MQCPCSTDYGWGLFREKESVKNSERYHRTYTWNEKNQLVSTSDSRYTVNYVYGQDGQRAVKYTAQSETLYFNKMWTLHTDGGNSHLGGEYAKNVYLGETRIVTKLVSANEIRAWEEVNKIYFYHSDHLGSASLITDENGNEYQRLEYTPYGEVWVDKYSQIQESTALLPYKFTGKERDEETGLYYYGARYLDAKYSRWISTDPALDEYVEGKSNGSSGGIYNSINLNLYHYAGNNPINYTDPTGMELEEGASVSEQLSYLEKIVFASYDTPQAKADAAKNLRTEMRGDGAKNFNLDELFYGKDGDEKFMNENLREFLNTSDTGNAYTLSDMNGKGWRKMGRLGSSEHQHNKNGGRNVKYVNDLDGREAIFDAQKNFISSGLDVGTYNYGSTGGISRLFGWVSWSSHGKYDMMPFFRQNNINPIYWPFTNIDSCNYGINSVNRYWKGRLDTGRRDV